MANSLGQKLVADAAPLLDPKLRALEQKVRATLGLPAAQTSGAAGPPSAPSGARPAAPVAPAAPAAPASATR